MPKEAIYYIKGLNLHLFSEMPLSAKKAEEYLLSQPDTVFAKIKEANPVIFRSLRVHLANVVLLDNKQQEIKEKCIKLKSEWFKLNNSVLSALNKNKVKQMTLKAEIAQCEEMLTQLKDSNDVFLKQKWVLKRNAVKKRYMDFIKKQDKIAEPL